MRATALLTGGMAVLLVGVSVLRVEAAGSPVLQSVEFDGEKTVRTSYGDLSLDIESVARKDGDHEPRVRGAIAGQPAFSMTLDGIDSDKPAATLKIVRLAGRVPQVLFEGFTMGAHCCTQTMIATSTSASNDKADWTVVTGDMLDGDGGYELKDIDGDGDAELVGHDDSFLYAYAFYADSIAPVKIEKLDGTRLADVSRDPRYRQAVIDSLAYLDRLDDPQKWHSNGFLAGWVATRALLGQGREAWARMLRGFDRHSDWTVEVCRDDVPLERCKEGRTRAATFPEALRDQLARHGYIEQIADYPLPPAAPAR